MCEQNETIQVGGITVQVVRPIAEGAYAQVLLVRSTATSETFALKRVICQSEEVEKDVHMELQVFRVRFQVFESSSVDFLRVFIADPAVVATISFSCSRSST